MARQRTRHRYHRSRSGAFQHGHTYLAHPLACAGALEVQRVIGEERLLDKVMARGGQLERRLTERFGNHRHVGDIRGRGLFWAVELVVDRTTRKPFDPGLKLNQRIKAERSSGGWPVIRPAERWTAAAGITSCWRRPTFATAEDIDMIVDRLGHAVDSALKSVVT